jgi:hypothetical protein
MLESAEEMAEDREDRESVEAEREPKEGALKRRGTAFVTGILCLCTSLLWKI